MRAAVIAAACLGILALAVPAAGAKKHKSKTYNATLNVNAPVPDRGVGATAPYGVLNEPFTVGKKFKGKTVSNVDVTLKATGSAANALSQLAFRVVAPNGRTVFLTPPPFGPTDTSMGPLTFSANSETLFCFGVPPCADPERTLHSPWVGTVSEYKLAIFTGIPMKGTWLVRVFDQTNTLTSVLNSVGLSITPQK